MNASNGLLPRGGGRSLVILAPWLAAPLLAACGGSSTPEWPKGNVVLHDETNYTSQTTLTLPKIPTASGADLMICWDGLMKDLLCHNIAPPATGIDNVSFLKIANLSQDTVAKKLAIGALDENLVTKYREKGVDSAAATKCANLSEFKLGTDGLTPATDYVEPEAGKTITYMLLFETGTVPGVGSRAMAFLEPMAASTVMTVAAPDACSNNVLDFHATLGTPMPISATDKTKWHVDWSQITKDSFGNDITFTKLDNVMVGYYQGKTAADLMTSFKDIDMIATTLWEMPVAKGARDVDLQNATIKGGTDKFPGFTETGGIYAMAVTCSKCQVPAPPILITFAPQP